MNEQNHRNTKSPYNEKPNEEQKNKDNRLQTNSQKPAILNYSIVLMNEQNQRNRQSYDEKPNEEQKTKESSTEPNFELESQLQVNASLCFWIKSQKMHVKRSSKMSERSNKRTK